MKLITRLTITLLIVHYSVPSAGSPQSCTSFYIPVDIWWKSDMHPSPEPQQMLRSGSWSQSWLNRLCPSVPFHALGASQMENTIMYAVNPATLCANWIYIQALILHSRPSHKHIRADSVQTTSLGLQAPKPRTTSLNALQKTAQSSHTHTHTHKNAELTTLTFPLTFYCSFL